MDHQSQDQERDSDDKELGLVDADDQTLQPDTSPEAEAEAKLTEAGGEAIDAEAKQAGPVEFEDEAGNQG